MATSVCTLLMYEKSLVQKLWTTATTALMPCPLSCNFFTVSCSCVFDYWGWDQNMLKYSSHVTSQRRTKVYVVTLRFSPLNHSHTQMWINFTQAGSAVIPSENPEQAQCVACRAWNHGGAIENVCMGQIWSVLDILSVYCRCTSVIGSGGCKHGRGDPKRPVRNAFYCYFFFSYFVW